MFEKYEVVPEVEVEAVKITKVELWDGAHDMAHVTLKGSPKMTYCVSAAIKPRRGDYLIKEERAVWGGCVKGYVCPARLFETKYRKKG